MPKPPPKPLHANQQRAIALLSLGMDMSSVASDCNITRGTLYRWKKDPRFQRALTRQIGEMMGAVVEQIQNQARVLIAGGLDSANKLRQLVLDDRVKPGIQRQASSDMLRYQGRFLDMLGFSAKVANQRRLASEELKDLEDADPGPENMPPEEYGDIDEKPVSEQTPPNPCFFYHTPPVAEDFRANPINDDGTPYTPDTPDTPYTPDTPETPVIGEQGSGTGDPRNPGVPPGVPTGAELSGVSPEAETVDRASLPDNSGVVGSPNPDASERPNWRPPPHRVSCNKRCCNPPLEDPQLCPAVPDGALKF